MPYFLTQYGDLQPNGEYKLSTSTDSLIVSPRSLVLLDSQHERR